MGSGNVVVQIVDDVAEAIAASQAEREALEELVFADPQSFVEQYGEHLDAEQRALLIGPQAP